ncbi:MAG: xylulokinase, partial [Gammaproteobacteria bacterium]|nr:xylulokinase [Gammaproteobacteria bacterium]
GARSFGLGNEASLLAAAATLSPAQREHAPLFLPYLSGERSPHNDAHAKGVLYGLAHAHGPADIAYAVVEGVSFGLRDGLDTLSRPSGDTVLVGGGARSGWWAQLLADVLELPLAVCEGSEAGGALGAARLAWLADGGQEGRVCLAPAVRQRFEPDGSQRATHAGRRARFNALYGALRPAFAALLD